MNGHPQNLLVLFSVLLGCADRAPVVAQDERQSSVKQLMQSRTRTATLEQLQGVHPDPPLILKTNAFDLRTSPSGTSVFSADRDGVGLWDIAHGKRTRLFEHSEIVLGVSVASAGERLLTVATGRTTPARLWNVRTGELLMQLPSPFEEVELESQPAPKDYGWNQWGHPDIWRFAWSGIVPPTGFGFTCGVFDQAGRRVATGCEDGRVIIWDLANQEAITTLATGLRRILAIEFSADGSRLLVAGKDDRMQLWSMDEHELLRAFDETRNENWVTGYRPAITFSTDGVKFALYSPHKLAILVCDSKSGETLYQIAEDSRLPSGKLQLSLRRGLAFIDDSTLFSNTGGWIKIWDIPSGSLLQQQECKSGVNTGYAYPSIQFVEFIRSLDAFIAVEVENDENTGHEDWTTVSLRVR